MDDIIFRLLSIIIPLVMGVVMLLIVGGAILSFNSTLNGWKKRAPVYEQLARELGLVYATGEPLSNIHGAEYFRLFNLGSKYNRQIQHLLRGTINNFQVSIFEYTYYVAFSSVFSRWKAYRQTVLMIESPRISLPLFSMRPRPQGFLQKMNSAVDKSIGFPHDPNFSGRYELIGRDEPRIRQTFNNQILHLLGATENLNLEGGGSRFLFYFDGRLAAPEGFRPMLDEGLRIAKLFEF